MTAYNPGDRVRILTPTQFAGVEGMVTMVFPISFGEPGKIEVEVSTGKYGIFTVDMVEKVYGCLKEMERPYTQYEIDHSIRTLDGPQ